MRGFLVLVLVGAALGAGLIAMMINNPGYALLVWAGYRLEASPYALILLVASATLLVFFVLRFVSQLLGVLPGISQWWRHRRQRQEPEDRCPGRQHQPPRLQIAPPQDALTLVGTQVLADF